MRRAIEVCTYGALIGLALIALGLFALLPTLSLVTALVYQGF